MNFSNSTTREKNHLNQSISRIFQICKPSDSKKRRKIRENNEKIRQNDEKKLCQNDGKFVKLKHPGRNFIPTLGGVLVKWVGIKFLPGLYDITRVGTEIPTWVPITKNHKNNLFHDKTIKYSNAHVTAILSSYIPILRYTSKYE